MSAFVVFDCLVLLPTESVKKFKDLFHHSINEPEKQNFGVAANWNEAEIESGRTQIVFDCQNGQGIYWGWYKKKIENKNMEEYCTELRVEKLIAFNDWHEDMDNEYWMYQKEDGLTLLSQANSQSAMKVDVDQGIDYVEQKIFKIYHTIEDLILLSKRLGHRDVKETLNTYSHLFPNAQKKILESIDEGAEM